MENGRLKDLFWIALLENQPDYVGLIFEELCHLSINQKESGEHFSKNKEFQEYISREVILTRLYDFDMLSEVCHMNEGT